MQQIGDERGIRFRQRCDSESEAHYLSAYINSDYPNGMIKEFQSRGLFGERDIHKLIVKVPFPKYKKGESDHDSLSDLGRCCAQLAAGFVKRVNVRDLKPGDLGRVRVPVDRER